MSALTPDETILGLLAAQPQHGYQLLDCFNRPQQLGLVWKLSTSQLYAVLKRLERLGWICGTEQASETAPPRVAYAITAAGRNVLDAWLNELNPSPSVRRVRVEFLSRLYIAHLLGRPIQPIVSYQRQSCLRDRARIEAMQVGIAPSVGQLAADMMSTQLDALLGWIDRCEAALSSVEA